MSFESALNDIHKAENAAYEVLQTTKDASHASTSRKTLPSSQYKRYSRQLLVTEWGTTAQTRLYSAQVLVIGAGGLGCPCIEFLAASGVGSITVMDDDTVELSNLHRQVLHTEDRARVGMTKAESTVLGVMRINSDVHVTPVVSALSPEFLRDPGVGPVAEAMQSGDWDLVIDASDNAATRYLANRYAYVHDIPLVSGAAVRGDGIVTSYPFSPSYDGPCYHCLFPYGESVDDLTRLDDASGAGQCSDRGVLGITCAMVGTHMANEAIRMLLGKTKKVGMTLFKPLGIQPVTPVAKIRPRSASCPVCSVPNRHASWSAYLSRSHLPSFDGKSQGVEPLPSDQRLTGRELDALRAQPNVALVDVRVPSQFSITALPNFVNIPYETLKRDTSLLGPHIQDKDTVAFVCRRGNDSLRASRLIKEKHPELNVYDLEGGLGSWTEVDSSFPMY